MKNIVTILEKETKQNNVGKFEIRDQNKSKTEAKWKYKVRPLLFFFTPQLFGNLTYCQNAPFVEKSQFKITLK